MIYIDLPHLILFCLKLQILKNQRMSDQSQQVSAGEFNNMDDDQQNDDSVELQFKQKNQKHFASESEFFTINGMFFCAACKNILQPISYNSNVLEFKCKSCDSKTIDFKEREGQQCMLYSKALQAGSRKAVANQNFIFDATMPRLSINCPQCEYPTAAYMVSPDDGQRKIIVKLICLRGSAQGTVKCGQIWELDQSALIFKDILKYNQDE